MLPRYQVCGGWKTDWTQTYSIPTKYHLTTKDDDLDFYMFNFTYLHAYDVLLTEDYTVEVTLPYGAHDIKVSFFFDKLICIGNITIWHERTIHCR